MVGCGGAAPPVCAGRRQPPLRHGFAVTAPPEGEALSAAAGRLPQSARGADSPLLVEGAFGAEGGLGFGDALSIASIHFRAHLGHSLGQGSWVDLEGFCRGIFILFYIGSESSVMPIHIKQRVKSKHKI